MPTTSCARVGSYGLMPSYRLVGPAWLTWEDTRSSEPLPHLHGPTLAPAYTKMNECLQVINLSIHSVIMLAWVQPKLSASVFSAEILLMGDHMVPRRGNQQRCTALASPYGSGFVEHLSWLYSHVQLYNCKRRGVLSESQVKHSNDIHGKISRAGIARKLGMAVMPLHDPPCR